MLVVNKKIRTVFSYPYCLDKDIPLSLTKPEENCKTVIYEIFPIIITDNEINITVEAFNSIAKIRHRIENVEVEAIASEGDVHVNVILWNIDPNPSI